MAGIHREIVRMMTMRADLNRVSVNREISSKKSNPSPRSGVRPRFIDLFAGIGGMRMGFESAGFQCVFSSEWDQHAARTYSENFGEEPAGDIRSVRANDLPDFDVLVAGFPCQPFSIAGVSKKNALGRAHGFLDKTQGTLFFEIARILEERRPPVVVLENVKNLASHDKGRTLETIKDALTGLGYHVEYRVLDARPYVPQGRSRIFIVGFQNPQAALAFQFPQRAPAEHPRLQSILEPKVPAKYHLSDKLWAYLQNYREKHRALGHGFGFGLADLNGATRTLSARYYKDGSEILIPVKGKNPRRLTPRECARLMGFPEEFRIVVSDTQAYKQFGNSVIVPLVRDIAKSVRKAISAARETNLRPQARSVASASAARRPQRRVKALTV
ncbi:MAG: DNA (cytosine-5-)-methyltransferase [Spirochaetia bacterium]|nr:DNA (cytosine-5-)-methyltransferase [Spirochaetia bacterium]